MVNNQSFHPTSNKLHVHVHLDSKKSTGAKLTRRAYEASLNIQKLPALTQLFISNLTRTSKWRGFSFQTDPLGVTTSPGLGKHTYTAMGTTKQKTTV